MSEWGEISLGEGCEILDSLRVPLNADERDGIKGDVPYYGANGLQGFINKAIFDEPLILLAEDGGYFDEYETRPIAYRISGPSWVNNHAHILRVKKDGELDQDFTFYCLQHKNITPFIKGGTRAKLNQSELREIVVPKPPPNTQRRIATFLSTMDEVIEATEKLVEKHQQIKAGLMHDLFTRGLWTRPELARGDHHGTPAEATAQAGQLRPPPDEAPRLYQDSRLGPFPKAWFMQPLLSVASYQHGRPFPSSDYSDSGVVLLRPGNLHPTGIVRYDNRHTTRIPRKWVNECPDLVVSVNDILMNLTAQSLDDQFLGRVCIVQDGEPAMLNQRIARFTPKGIHHHYLYWLLRSVQFRRQIDRTSQGTKVQHIYNSDLNKISFAVPTDPGEQRAMSEILYSATEQLATYEDNLAKLRQQKQGLMHDLLTGRVRVDGAE